MSQWNHLLLRRPIYHHLQSPVPGLKMTKSKILINFFRCIPNRALDSSVLPTSKTSVGKISNKDILINIPYISLTFCVIRRKAINFRNYVQFFLIHRKVYPVFSHYHEILMIISGNFPKISDDLLKFATCIACLHGRIWSPDSEQIPTKKYTKFF